MMRVLFSRNENRSYKEHVRDFFIASMSWIFVSIAYVEELFDDIL